MTDKPRELAAIVLTWPQWPDHANTFLAIRDRLLRHEHWQHGDAALMKLVLNAATVIPQEQFDLRMPCMDKSCDYVGLPTSVAMHYLRSHT